MSTSGRSTFANTDTTYNAKGDIIVATADNAAAALTEGADGTTLMADVAQTSGLLWTRNDAAKSMQGFLGWTFDTNACSTSIAPSAATIFLCKIPIPYTMTITTVWVAVNTAGTSYTNAQLGLYQSDGTFLKATAVQASAGTNGFGTLGAQGINLSSTQAITGGPTVFVWVAFHAGTNAATAIKLQSTNVPGAIVNGNVAAASARFATQTGHVTNSLATIGNLTPGSNILTNGSSFWMGIS